MSEVILTESQKAAIAKICDWYRHRTHEQQVFRIYGFAGVGKTTIVKYAIGELGLESTDPRTISKDDDESEQRKAISVLFATLTGKAALVMRKHGLPCVTIHSLIYAYVPATEAEVAKAEQDLASLRMLARDHQPGSVERVVAEGACQAKYLDIKKMKRPRFVLNDQSILRDADLLVLDEMSMVDAPTAADILGFERPVLLIGDPGQLPPINNDGGFGPAPPDVFLEEIHRQAQDSPIIRLATMARQGIYIPYGRYSEAVWKMPRVQISPPDMLMADQVICGMNATRLHLNNQMRQAKGFAGEFPVGPEDKLICLRNNHDLGLLNGMFVTMDEVQPHDDIRFYADVTTDEGAHVGNRSIYTGHFFDHIAFDKDRADRDWMVKKGLIEATFGYAITCHKAQGSGFENVIVFDDGWGRGAERNRWLYTAITRAESGLLILA